MAWNSRIIRRCATAKCKTGARRPLGDCLKRRGCVVTRAILPAFLLPPLSGPFFQSPGVMPPASPRWAPGSRHRRAPLPHRHAPRHEELEGNPVESPLGCQDLPPDSVFRHPANTIQETMLRDKTHGCKALHHSFRLSIGHSVIWTLPIVLTLRASPSRRLSCGGILSISLPSHSSALPLRRGIVRWIRAPGRGPAQGRWSGPPRPPAPR